jgi:hypothetical protein
MTSKKKRRTEANHVENYSLEQKKEWFLVFSSQRKKDSKRTISDFLAYLRAANAKTPSKATMGRIVQDGLKNQWPGWEEIKGRCMIHPNVILQDGNCEACTAEEILRLRSPKSLRSEEIAAREFPKLDPNSPLKQFLASTLPVEEYVNYFVPRNPNQTDPEVYYYDGHDEADD